MAVADISARASTRRRGAERRPRSSRLASRRLPASASLFSRHATSQARLDEAGRSRAGTRQHGRTEIGRRHHGRKLRSSKSRRIWNRTIASGSAPILLPPTFTESGSSAKAGWIKTGPVAASMSSGRAGDHMRWFWSLYGVVGKPPKVHTKRPCGDARGGARIARRGA